MSERRPYSRAMVSPPEGEGAWADHYRALGFSIFPTCEEAIAAGFFPTTRCSKTKGKGGDRAVPRDFYLSQTNLRFYAWAEGHVPPLEYGILSDLYGVHFWNEALAFYDIHPSTLSDRQLLELGRTIGRKCRMRGITHLLFTDSSPIFSTPYLVMLLNSGLQVAYSMRLHQ